MYAINVFILYKFQCDLYKSKLKNCFIFSETSCINVYTSIRKWIQFYKSNSKITSTALRYPLLLYLPSNSWYSASKPYPYTLPSEWKWMYITFELETKTTLDLFPHTFSRLPVSSLIWQIYKDNDKWTYFLHSQRTYSEKRIRAPASYQFSKVSWS